MGDEQKESMRDYCGKVSINQEPEWSPPSNHNNSEGIFWDDLADLYMESQGDNISDVSKQSMEGSWQPLVASNANKWKDHIKWLKNWMRLAPKSKHYAKRPFSAKKRRKIEYQQNVVR
jgi:hypothetical protein